MASSNTTPPPPPRKHTHFLPRGRVVRVPPPQKKKEEARPTRFRGGGGGWGDRPPGRRAPPSPAAFRLPSVPFGSPGPRWAGTCTAPGAASGPSRRLAPGSPGSDTGRAPRENKIAGTLARTFGKKWSGFFCPLLGV